MTAGANMFRRIFHQILNSECRNTDASDPSAYRCIPSNCDVIIFGCCLCVDVIIVKWKSWLLRWFWYEFCDCMTSIDFWISRKRRERAKKDQVGLWHSLRLAFAIEWNHCEYCTSWPWPLFSKSNFFCYVFVWKKCTGSGCPRHIFLDSHVPAVEMLLLYLPANV